MFRRFIRVLLSRPEAFSPFHTRMTEIFAGIAVLPAGLEEYNVSVSLISSDDKWSPTTIGTKTSSSPVKMTAITETVRSLIFSISPELTTSTIRTYLTSVPPALPADQCYDIFKALENANLIDLEEVIDRLTPLPCNHGEAYTIRLPKGKSETMALLALDFSTPDYLCAASLSSEECRGRRINFDRHELRVPVYSPDKNSLHNAVKTILESPVVSHENLGQIVLIMPPTPPEIDIGALVANICPNVPVSIPTPHEIAEAAASFIHADLRRRTYRVCYRGCPTIHVSVATASGTIVPLANKSQGSYHGPPSIILTNSVTNQKSVSVRLLIGNHSQAKDNIRRAVVVLDGLNPLPKGHAKIRVSIDMVSIGDHARVVVQQKGGPKKTFLFPHFFSDLVGSRRYDILVKTEPEIEFSPDFGVPKLDWEREVWKNDLWSRKVMGTLPE